ncbi:hypothetical protein ZWY2020_045039 [Hordeum vulgare]|nr:hypothetical protein ZWY2020_045039 [Hordeum vulgare]
MFMASHLRFCLSTSPPLHYYQHLHLPCLPSRLNLLSCSLIVLSSTLDQAMVAGAMVDLNNKGERDEDAGGAGCIVASCNGRDAGHAVRRPPTEWERGVLQSMRTMTAGVGALPAAAAHEGIDEEVMYMRATYERVVGSKDAVSYHLISPRTAGDSPPQELSLFLLRTRGD